MSRVSRTSNSARLTVMSDCFAMVLTAGFYCDSRAHNVRKVRVVKYILVYGQIKAADQKKKEKLRKEISFRP